jgi:hypothetical protein
MTMIDRTAGPWTASKDAAVSRVGEETVLLHLRTGTYFGLDPVGSRVWRGLEDARAVADICADIAAEFGAEPDQVREDVDIFLRDLAEHQLIERR